MHLTGHGLGGRNQELALAAAPALARLRGCCVFSVGSDGTDGPTDAAGGYADGEALAALTAAGLDVPRALADNDAYHALQAVGGLIMTGPTAQTSTTWQLCWWNDKKQTAVALVFAARRLTAKMQETA